MSDFWDSVDMFREERDGFLGDDDPTEEDVEGYLEHVSEQTSDSGWIDVPELDDLFSEYGYD